MPAWVDQTLRLKKNHATRSSCKQPSVKYIPWDFCCYLNIQTLLLGRNKRLHTLLEMALALNQMNPIQKKEP